MEDAKRSLAWQIIYIKIREDSLAQLLQALTASVKIQVAAWAEERS